MFSINTFIKANIHTHTSKLTFCRHINKNAFIQKHGNTYRRADKNILTKTHIKTTKKANK